MDAEGFVAARKVAELAGVSAETVRDWTRRGLIPAYRPGGREYLYVWSEVEAAIKATRVGTLAEPAPTARPEIRPPAAVVPPTTRGRSFREEFRRLQQAAQPAAPEHRPARRRRAVNKKAGFNSR